jgi:hypothetical protein
MAQNSNTKADTLRTIKRLSRSGTSLNYAAVRHRDGRLLAHGCKQFGSWNAALQAAGLDPTKIRRCPCWSKRDICEQLRDLHAKRMFPDIRTLSQKYSALYWACCRHFGGGLAALQAAGIDYEELLGEHPRRWTKARIIAEIQRRDKEGLMLHLAVILRKEPRLRRFCYAVLHQFGTWSQALRAAGLRLDVVRNRHRKWPRTRVLQEIRCRHVEGKLLNTDLMLREDLALHTAGRRHFGTWKKAVEQAGINYNQYVRGGLYGWTRSKTQRALWDRLVANRGSRKQVQEQSPSLYRAALHYFHTWEGAVRKARERK